MSSRLPPMWGRWGSLLSLINDFSRFAKMRSLRVWAIPVVIGAMALWGQFVETDELAEAIFKYGFLEILPPTTLMGPGTLLVVEKQSGKHVMVREICAIDPAELASKWEKSESYVIDNKLNRKFALSASVLERFGVGGHAGEDSSIRIQNTHACLSG